MKTSIVFVFALFLTAQSHAQPADTERYWKCSDRVGGSWIFGTAPQACTAEAFISENFVEDKFSNYIFDESKNMLLERIRYMTEMNHLVSEAAEYYLKKRKPSVSKTELSWWKRSVLAITHQESFMTHYRQGRDRKLRMMRGDFGHGHGLMQVDDRWHFAAVSEGKAANLIDNLFYALDIFYAGWQSAPNRSCVGGATNFYNRARSAYGVYNGGNGAACRFLNPSHKWARNDKNFKDKLDGQSWMDFISRIQIPKKVNIACLSNNSSSNCESKTSPPKVVIPRPIPNRQGKVLSYRGLLCALEDDSYHCISQPEQRFCLVDKYNLINEVVRTIAVKPVVLLSKEDVCGSDSAPYEVGDFLQAKKNINLRQTPGGLWIDMVRVGEVYQILDVYTVESKKNSRYYRVKRGNNVGYFYAGNEDSFEDWAALSDETSELVIPVAGSRVSIETRSGTNLRQSPGGSWLITVPSGTELEVIDTVIADEANKLYIEVEHNGHRGFMYSGRISPTNTIKNWIDIK